MKVRAQRKWESMKLLATANINVAGPLARLSPLTKAYSPQFLFLYALCSDSKKKLQHIVKMQE